MGCVCIIFYARIFRPQITVDYIIFLHIFQENRNKLTIYLHFTSLEFALLFLNSANMKQNPYATAGTNESKK